MVIHCSLFSIPRKLVSHTCNEAIRRAPGAAGPSATPGKASAYTDPHPQATRIPTIHQESTRPRLGYSNPTQKAAGPVSQF
jgi:hypothetical protein